MQESGLRTGLKKSFVTCSTPDTLPEGQHSEVDSFHAWTMPEETDHHSTAESKSISIRQEHWSKAKAKSNMMRASFDTPEARHSFCLTAFRPSAESNIHDMQSDDSDASSSYEDAQPRALSICPKLQFTVDCGLERTDKPVAGFMPLREELRNASASLKGNRAVRVHAFRQPLTSPSSSLKVDELWCKIPEHQYLNPFEGQPNDSGFFGHATPKST